MKKLILFSVFSIALTAQLADQAQAQPLRERNETICRSTNIVDGGYLVTFDDVGRSARLEEQTIAGPRLLANLLCEKLKGQSMPDALNNTLVCRAPNGQDGWLVRKYVGGFAGLTFASVRYVKVVNGGAVEQEVAYGRLSCERR